jgi:hypothetical protein
LAWLANYRCRIYSVGTPRHSSTPKHGVIVLQRVVSVVVSEGPLRAHLVRVYFTDQGKFGGLNQWKWAVRIVY